MADEMGAGTGAGAGAVASAGSETHSDLFASGAPAGARGNRSANGAPTGKPVEAKFGLFRRAYATFFSPYRLMCNVRQHPAIIPPMILIVLLSMAEWPLEAALQNPYFFRGFSTADARIVLLMIARTSMRSSISVIFVACLDALLLLILVLANHGNATYLRLYSAKLHVWVVQMFIGLIIYTIIHLTGSSRFPLSLAALLVPDGDLSMFGYNVLLLLSPFTLWTAALVYFGVKALNDDFGPARCIAVTALNVAISAMLAAVWLMHMNSLAR